MVKMNNKSRGGSPSAREIKGGIPRFRGPGKTILNAFPRGAPHEQGGGCESCLHIKNGVPDGKVGNSRAKIKNKKNDQ